jgi:hypothetical protein
MRRAILASLMAATFFSSANAAEMQVSKPAKKGDYHIVYINGDIENGDFDKFKEVAGKLPAGKVIVSLNSEGGQLGAALNMGAAIRSMKWWTVARSCASACALMWLAGVQRGVFEESHVGFHSAYNGETKAIENGSANAVIGAYVTRLGFGYDVVGYVTSAKPENMDWLDAEKAKKYSIAFTNLGSMEPNKKQSQSQGQPNPKKYGVNEAPSAQSLELIPYVEGNKNFSISLPFFRISFNLGAPRRYASAPRRHTAARHQASAPRRASAPPSTPSASSSSPWNAVKGSNT